MTPEKEEANAAKTAQVLRTAMENFNTPGFQDFMKIFATDLRMRFVALIEAGFTEAQALQIVIERKP